MLFDIEHNGMRIEATHYPAATAAGFPAAVAGAALKGAALAAIASAAEHDRMVLDDAAPGKLAAYRIKEDIARDPASASEAELALIDREAAARGLTRDALLAVISTKAAAYRQTALLIEAMTAEASTAIAAIPDAAPDIEAQVQAALTASDTEAQSALAEAQNLINGG